MTCSSSDISKTIGPLRFARIEPAWRGEIAVCVGSGPSLVPEDTYACRHHRVIAVNDAVRLTWGAVDVLYAPDGKWWKSPPFAVAAAKRTFTLDPEVEFDRVELLNYRSRDGLSLDPTTVHTGGHSGYQAINVAAHYRPRRIVLLGYDMMPSPTGAHHFFGDHADGSHVNYEYKLGVYHSLVKPLADLGIEIVNASRISAIDAFPRVSLAAALAD